MKRKEVDKHVQKAVSEIWQQKIKSVNQSCKDKIFISLRKQMIEQIIRPIYLKTIHR